MTFSGSRGQQAAVAIFMVRPDGTREPFVSDMPNPTSLAFDREGHLYVTDALAGWSGIYRVRLDAPASPELVLAGGTLIGLAFDPHGGLAIATSDSVYRLAVGVRGLLPLH